MLSEFNVVEASIAEIREALDRGIVTSVEPVAAYLNRIAFYDRQGIRLNAVPVLNRALFAEAQAADARRAQGRTIGPLDGVPYTAKDSYKVRGLTVAAGSPAFERLVATDDAFTIAQLRAAGAILIGLTNMPPMACGGMERGVYGRAESPYNERFLTAAFFSGSSNGSGTATAASFAAFGLGEETWSSGRAPASNNGLVAYTPSRGVISMRGNWPLVPTMDVVVPHTRSVSDMFDVLDVIVADDPDPRGDFWRMQKWVELPPASHCRPQTYRALADREALRGRRLGVPRMYINGEADSREPIETRPSVIELWQQARRDLEALGAEVVEVDFPVVSNYERDGMGGEAMIKRGLVPPDYLRIELGELCIFAWEDFLAANADPNLHALADVDGPRIFPLPQGALPDRMHQRRLEVDLAEYARRAKAEGVMPLERIPTIAEGIRGLERARAIDLEQWLDENSLDAVVFPAVADVGPADADIDQKSSDIAWRNGTWVANGNLVIRHLGIPTVTVPMGVMRDIGMPVGLTFAGKAYEDATLLRYAYAFEQSGSRRVVPPRTPPLPSDAIGVGKAVPPQDRRGRVPTLTLAAAIAKQSGDEAEILVEGETSASHLSLFIDGQKVEPVRSGTRFTARRGVALADHRVLHSEWREPYGSMVIAVAADDTAMPTATYAVVGGLE
jgi:amidase